MKKIMLTTAVILIVVFTNAQSGRKAGQGQMEFIPAKTLPEGAVLNQGKIEIKKGYTVKYADNKQVVIVQKTNGSVTGSFACFCSAKAGGGCSTVISGTSITCVASGCTNCKLVTTVDPTAGVAITKSSANWKEVIVPTAK